MLSCCCVNSKFNSRAGNTVTLGVENNRLHRLNSTSHARTCTKMIDMVACLIARVTGFFLIDIVNKVQT